MDNSSIFFSKTSLVVSNASIWVFNSLILSSFSWIFKFKLSIKLFKSYTCWFNSSLSAIFCDKSSFISSNLSCILTNSKLSIFTANFFVFSKAAVVSKLPTLIIPFLVLFLSKGLLMKGVSSSFSFSFSISFSFSFSFSLSFTSSFSISFSFSLSLSSSFSFLSLSLSLSSGFES